MTNKRGRSDCTKNKLFCSLDETVRKMKKHCEMTFTKDLPDEGTGSKQQRTFQKYETKQLNKVVQNI